MEAAAEKKEEELPEEAAGGAVGPVTAEEEEKEGSCGEEILASCLLAREREGGEDRDTAQKRGVAKDWRN